MSISSIHYLLTLRSSLETPRRGINWTKSCFRISSLGKKKGDPIRAWCASCASGEEPYSLAMLLAEKLNDAFDDYEITIYATDIDESALAEARKGRYSLEKLKNVKPEFIDKYFTQDN